MLVLSRKKGQRIVIDGSITVTVVDTGRSVRVGVDAPRDMKIVREELIHDEADGRKPAKSAA